MRISDWSSDVCSSDLNAGVGYLFGPLVEATQEMWDTVLNVNLRGAFFATKHAVRQMLTQEVQEGWGRGRIVSIGSRGSKSGTALTRSEERRVGKGCVSPCRSRGWRCH